MADCTRAMGPCTVRYNNHPSLPTPSVVKTKMESQFNSYDFLRWRDQQQQQQQQMHTHAKRLANPFTFELFYSWRRLMAVALPFLVTRIITCIQLLAPWKHLGGSRTRQWKFSLLYSLFFFLRRRRLSVFVVVIFFFFDSNNTRRMYPPPIIHQRWVKFEFAGFRFDLFTVFLNFCQQLWKNKTNRPLVLRNSFADELVTHTHLYYKNTYSSDGRRSVLHTA